MGPPIISGPLRDNTESPKFCEPCPLKVRIGTVSFYHSLNRVKWLEGVNKEFKEMSNYVVELNKPFGCCN